MEVGGRRKERGRREGEGREKDEGREGWSRGWMEGINPRPCVWGLL